MRRLIYSLVILTTSLGICASETNDVEETGRGVRGVFETAALYLMYGGLESTYAMLPDQNQSFPRDISRTNASPRLPIIRADFLYQSFGGGEADQISDHALTYRIQAGWGPIAAEFSATDFQDVDRGEAASPLRHAYLLYRMSYWRVFEWDVGIGSLIVEDASGSWESSTALTSPFRLHFNSVTVECLNSWGEIDGESVRDTELAFIGYRENFGVRAGYRWVGGPASLDFHGAFAGVSLFW